MSELVFSGVSKSFGSHRVLHELSFHVGAGEFAVLLGPNGAGKSTSIALATGLARPDAGEILMAGHPAGSLISRRFFAYVPQEPAFPGNVRARDLMKFAAAHSENSAVQLNEITSELGVNAFAKTQVRHLSGGQKRALSLACAFAMNPRLVILDEPTVGLDLEMRRRTWRFLERYHQAGGSVLMTTHYLAEAEELAERIIVLNEGRVLQSASPDEIKRQYGYKRILFTSPTAPPEAWGARCLDLPDRWQLDSRSPDQVLREMVDWPGASDIDVAPLALEDVFLKLVGRET